MQVCSSASTAKDAFTAGREAAGYVVRHIAGPPSMLWVFSSVIYDQQRLLEGIRSVAAGVPLVGCTTDGEISSAGLTQDSVVILALASADVQFHTAFTSSLSRDSHTAGKRIGEAFQNRDCQYLQIFSDGLTGNAVEIIEGIQSILGENIRIAGGTSGDGGRFLRTFQYLGDQVLTDSIVAVGFSGNFAVGTGVGCGWFPVGTAKQVTKSEGNILYELDGQPALQVYEKFLDRYASQLPAVGVEYPLGLLGTSEDDEDHGYFLCRATMGVDRQNGSIRFAGDIPQGAKVKMTMGNGNDVVDAARKAAKRALSHMKKMSGEIQAKAIFVYSCMARKIVLGSRTSEEIAVIRKIVGDDVPIIGFYTYGEYAPSGKQNRSHFHNETVTLTILGE